MLVTSMLLLMLTQPVFGSHSDDFEFVTIQDTQEYQECIADPPTCVELDVYGDELFGTIPTEIGLLTEMTYFDVDDNFLTGTIPTELGKCSKLLDAELYTNWFTGSIPTEIGSLTDMTYFDVEENYLTGPIPTEFGRLAALEGTHLNDNSLYHDDGPAWIDVRSGLTGPIPTELGNLNLLEYAYLGDNRLTGTLPTEFGRLKVLSDLGLDTNRLTGTFPTELGEMDALSYFSSYKNPFTGTLPTELARLTDELSFFNVYGTLICGDFDDVVPSDVSENFSYGIVSPNLGRCAENDEDIFMCAYFSDECDNLDTDGDLGGTIPTEIGLLTTLTYLDIDGDFFGSIPTEIGLLTMLTELYIEFTQLTSSIPTEIGNLVLLTELEIEVNYLTGTMPTELGMLTSLTELSIENNFITGTLPTELGLLDALTDLEVEYNLLTGPIPSEIGLLTALSLLDFYNNRLSGSVPSELAQVMDSAAGGDGERLRMYRNQWLCGALPDQFFADGVNDGVSDTDFVDDDDYIMIGNSEKIWPKSTNMALGIDCETLDEDGRNGIILAVIAGDMTALEIALADETQNVDKIDRTDRGANALMYASMYDHQDMAKKLLSAGADTSRLSVTHSVPANAHWSVYAYAAFYGTDKIMEMYLTPAPGYGMRDIVLDTPTYYYGMTPLHIAVWKEHCKTAKLLIDAGHDVDATDDYGQTPLHYAALVGATACAKDLIAAGADVTMASNSGGTALDYADFYDHSGIKGAINDAILDAVGPDA
jgi:Leucine-rich repeat (LRR) protein